MRFLILILLTLSHTVVMADKTKHSFDVIEKRLFVSSSMPESLLSQSFEQAQRLHVTVVFNGFIDNSMPKTAKWLSKLTEKYPELSIQIDPVSFEDFGIDAVPAVVVSKGKVFDVVFGNLDLLDALTLIHKRGDLKGMAL